MHQTSDTTLADGLISVRGNDDGGRRRRRLSDANARGELLRLDRGVYVDPSLWLGAAPWTRHLLTTRAHALTQPGAVFCRETALSLHGFPLLRAPQYVHVRTGSRSNTGRRRAQQMVSPAVSRNVLARHEDGGPQGRGLQERDLVPPAVKKVLVAGGAGRRRRPFHRPALHLDDQGLMAESLIHVLGDTVPRMTAVESAVVLDAARSSARCGPAISQREVEEAMLPWASDAAMRRWENAWQLADPGAESAGESVSRILMLEAGFQVPETQKEIRMPDGRLVRVDFFWPEVGLIGEFDGMEKYSRSRDFSGLTPARVVEEEKVREDELRALGHRVVRWTWGQMVHKRRLPEILLRAGVPRPHVSRTL